MIDEKELTEFTGITAANAEEFKTAFNEKYVLKDKAAEDKTVREKVSGAVLGAEMTNIKRFFKENEVEFSEEETKEILSLPSHKNEAMISLGFKKLQGGYVNKIAELEKTAGHGNDDKVKAITEEKQKIEKKLSEVESAWKTTASELEKERLSGQSTLKAYKIDTELSKAKAPLKIKQKLTEVEKIGFETAITQRLKFDLNEKGQLETFNANGDRIVSKQKAGDFLNATDALQELVNELGLAEINPHGGKPAPVNTGTPAPGFKRDQPTGQKILLRGQVTDI